MISGALPPVEFIDWIEMDATSHQQIDIPIEPTRLIRLDAEILSVEPPLRNTSWCAMDNISLFMQSNRAYIFNVSGSSSVSSSAVLDAGNKYTISFAYDPEFQTSYVIGVDNANYSNTSRDTTPKSYISFRINRSGHSNERHFKFYSVLIRTNVLDDTLFNLRPCRYRGEYGLWDTISNKFYGNIGTGVITGGNDE